MESKSERRRELFLEFVTKCHGEQRRKYTDEPYIVHPIAVAEMAKDLHPLAWEIALGHDVDEDTPYTCDDIHNFLLSTELYSSFEADFVRRGVIGLTDIFTVEAFPDFNREERKYREALRLGKTDALIQSIKYCDLIHNSDSIIKHDEDFGRIYLKEKKELLGEMRNGNFDLYMKAILILDEGMKKIKGRCKLKNLKVNNTFYYIDGNLYEYLGRKDGKFGIVGKWNRHVQFVDDGDVRVTKFDE